MLKIVTPYIDGKRRVTVGHLVEARIQTAVTCMNSRCQRIQPLDVHRIAINRGWTAPLTQLTNALRCSKCGDDDELIFPGASMDWPR